MTDPFDPKQIVIPNISKDIIKPFFPRRPTVRILIVTDTAVSFTTAFGVGMVVDLIRANVDGYVRFIVDLARLGTEGSSLAVNTAPGPKDPKYDNFRFSSQLGGEHVIDDYDQIWCFGFAPGNNPAGDDSDIWTSPYASTDQDLAVLTKWMNDGGGMLAMGDHHYLGAAMCARIPRVRSMRRWTIAQGVPPIGGPGRFDTNRPENAAQDATVTASPIEIPFDAQSDGIPQKIEWRRYGVRSPQWWRRRSRPHPLLCGGSLGVIDILPDHPHEGWVYEDTEIDLAASYGFNDVSGTEYPVVSGYQPHPQAIAWAHTLPDPPYDHFKGPSPAKRFAVIGAYDGDRGHVGRVVVDSTWHHWMDVNLEGLASESPASEYQKIARYYRNCAVWLARANQRQQMLNYATFWATLWAPSFEDFRLGDSVYVLGGLAIDVLGRLTGDCLASELVKLYIPDRLWAELQPKIPLPDPCWTCPPIELLERMVLGGIIKEQLPLRDRLLDGAGPDMGKRKDKPEQELHAAAVRGAKLGLVEFRALVDDNLAVLRRTAEHLMTDEVELQPLQKHIRPKFARKCE